MALCCMCVFVCVSSAELQLVVEQHFQRHEQTEAGLSDSPDTPSPIAAQQPNGAAAQWANHSSQESYVSCDEQAESSEVGGKWRSEPSRNKKKKKRKNSRYLSAESSFYLYASKSKRLQPLPRTGFFWNVYLILQILFQWQNFFEN